MKLRSCLLAATCALGFNALAATNIDLSAYQVTGNYALDANPGGSVSGLEASAITFAADRGTLFYVGDEGTGVVEISLTGQTLGAMSFSDWPAATSHNDAEGLTYVGNGVLVVAEERLQDAFQFGYVAGGSVNLANAPSVSLSNAAYNNNGLEGLSYDPRNGSFVSVKQQSPMQILGGTLSGSALAARRNVTRRPGEPDDVGHFFLALNPDAFRASGSFESDMDDLIDTLHDTPPARPDEPVLVAGEPEAAERARRHEADDQQHERQPGQHRDLHQRVEGRQHVGLEPARQTHRRAQQQPRRGLTCKPAPPRACH